MEAKTSLFRRRLSQCFFIHDPCLLKGWEATMGVTIVLPLPADRAEPGLEGKNSTRSLLTIPWRISAQRVLPTSYSARRKIPDVAGRPGIQRWPAGRQSVPGRPGDVEGYVRRQRPPPRRHQLQRQRPEVAARAGRC